MEKKLCFNWGKYEKYFSRKILLIMRLTMLLTLLTFGQLIASQSYSQTTRLNIDLKDATVEEVINKIEEQTNFYFLYNKKIIDVERKVNISVENKKVIEVLDLLFAKSDVSYTVIDRQIVLSGKEATQQPRNISGKITDSSGATLPGVTVVVKGTTSGTISDFNGNYSIGNVPANATLVLWEEHF